MSFCFVFLATFTHSPVITIITDTTISSMTISTVVFTKMPPSGIDVMVTSAEVVAVTIVILVEMIDDCPVSVTVLALAVIVFVNSVTTMILALILTTPAISFPYSKSFVRVF